MIRVIGIEDPEFDEIPYAPDDFPLSYEYGENTAEFGGLLEVLKGIEKGAASTAKIAESGRKIFGRPPAKAVATYLPSAPLYTPPSTYATKAPFDITKYFIPIGIVIFALGGGYMLLSDRKKRR